MKFSLKTKLFLKLHLHFKLVMPGSKKYSKTTDELKSQIKEIMYSFNYQGSLIIKPIDFFLRNILIYKNKKLIDEREKKDIIWECFRHLIVTHIVSQYDFNHIYLNSVKENDYPEVSDLLVVGTRTHITNWGAIPTFNQTLVKNELKIIGFDENIDYYFADGIESNRYDCFAILVKKSEQYNAFLIRNKYLDKIILDIDINKVHNHVEENKSHFEYQDFRELRKINYFITKCNCLNKDILI